MASVEKKKRRAVLKGVYPGYASGQVDVNIDKAGYAAD